MPNGVVCRSRNLAHRNVFEEFLKGSAWITAEARRTIMEQYDKDPKIASTYMKPVASCTLQ